MQINRLLDIVYVLPRRDAVTARELAALHGLSVLKTDDPNKALQKFSALFGKTAHDWLCVDFRIGVAKTANASIFLGRRSSNAGSPHLIITAPTASTRKSSRLKFCGNI